MARKGLLIVLVLLCQLVWADVYQPLTLESLPQLTEQYEGKRHAIVFWSLTCVPCRAELTELSKIKEVERLPLVLVNTGEESAEHSLAFLQDIGLLHANHWRFADSIPARLREAIDESWYGELPFSLAIAANGETFSHSGMTDIEGLVSWLTELNN